jgi:hypothetical protein
MRGGYLAPGMQSFTSLLVFFNNILARTNKETSDGEGLYVGS